MNNQRRLLDQLKTITQLEISQIFGDYDSLLSKDTNKVKAIKRVAIITEAFLPKVDGVTKTAYLTLRYLQETQREVIIFAPDISITQVNHTQIFPMPSIGMPMAPETRMGLPNPALSKQIKIFQPDLIHLFSPTSLSLGGIITGHELGIPIVANYQTDLPGYARQYGLNWLAKPLQKWLRYLHNRCHLNLVPTQTYLDELGQSGYKRLKIWERGINTRRFSPEKLSKTMRDRLLNGRDPNRLLCIYVGRLAPEKRLDLLHGIAKLEGIALTIIGDGASRKHLERAFADTDTFFTGYIFGEELPQAYASADIFCFPGQVETYGQVVQEAKASGLACIVVNQGGVSELIQHRETGLLSEANEADFSQSVVLLRDQPGLRKALAEAARKDVESKTWIETMASLESYYRDAVLLNQRYQALFGRTRHKAKVMRPKKSTQSNSYS
ncbi:glycosyltransferase family 1 protein [Anaerolineales bacterium]